jgi:uncharacterized CHY-type Zn-finger protein
MIKAKFKSIRPTPLESKTLGRNIYIKASIETIYEKTLIISAYAITKKNKNKGHRCIFQQFITEFDFVAINYLDSNEGAWSKSTLLRFIEVKRWDLDIENTHDYLKCETEADNEAINKFYQTKFKVGINLINEHQVNLRKQALHYKHDIERRELNRIHDQAIYLPADLHDWISDAIVKDNAKYFYETDKKSKQKRGICSYCKTRSTVTKAKHNDFGECPSCKSKIQFKGLNRAKYYVDYDYFAFAQRIDSGIMIRRFKVKLEYKHPDKLSSIETTEISLSELSRSALEESKTRSTHYEFGEFKKQEYRWKKEESYGAYYYSSSSTASAARNTYMRLYPFNLKEVISGTKWQYCAIELFSGKIDPMDYFEFEESKLLEMIVRRGFNKLAQDMLNTNYSSKTTYFKIMQSKSMGLNEYALFMAKKHDLGLKELAVLRQVENQCQVKLNIDQINWIVRVYQDLGRILNILKYSSLQKMINYIDKQSAVGDSDARAIIREWDDYIQMAAKFKYNLKDEILLYPKDLARRHDEVMIRAKAMENKRFNAGIKKTAKNFMWLNFSKFGLVLSVAKNTKEIIKESQILGHCVGRGTGYIERMSEGKTLILTIRKADSPNIPYFTVEVNPETFSVRQYESANRIRKSEEIDKFLKVWEKQVVKKSTGPKKTIKVRSNDYEHRIAN